MSGTTTAAQAIVFNEIPAAILVPGEYTEIRPNFSNIGVLSYPSRTLLFAQRSGAGTGVNNTVYTITSADQATALCGPGTPGATAAAAYLAGNPLAQLDIVVVSAPVSATSATGSFTLTGAPTAPGTLSVNVNGTNYRVGVGLTDTITSVTANLRAAIFSDPMTPLTLVAAAGVLTCTSKFLGALGNDINLVYNPNPGDAFPPGLAGVATQMAGGTTFPDITAAIAVAASTWYTDVVLPFYDVTNIGLLAADLDRRYTALGQQDAFSWTAYPATYGTAQTFAAGQEDRHMCFLPLTQSMSPPYVISSALAGVCSFALSNDPSRQLRGLTLPGVWGPSAANTFVESQRQLLLAAGQSTYNIEAGAIVLERMVTANTQTNLGIADPSWRDVMTVRTLSRIRYDWNSYRALLYPRAKLAPDGSLAAQSDTQATVTPMRAKGSWAARCALYEQLGWIVSAAQSAQQSVFQINTSDPNRLDQQLVVNITGNLMVDATVLEFQLGA